MDHGDMGHGGHGDMDHGDGGMHDMCNMNVCLELHDPVVYRPWVSDTNLLACTDALYMGHQESLHRL